MSKAYDVTKQKQQTQELPKTPRPPTTEPLYQAQHPTEKIFSLKSFIYGLPFVVCIFSIGYLLVNKC
tara:strand:+ start:190 stop:390 length:201 start_codon:yes stop_codon:yes gene_type:complete